MGLFGKKLVNPKVPVAPKIDLGMPGQVDFVVSLDKNGSRVSQIEAIISATTEAVGTGMPDFPYVGDQKFSGQDFGKYTTSANIYDRKGGNVMARFGFDEPSGLVFLTLEGDSREYTHILRENLTKAKIDEPEIFLYYSP